MPGRRDDRVAEVAHQRGRTSRRWATAKRPEPLCARLCDVHRHQAHLRGAHRRRPPGSPTSPAATGCPALDQAMRNFKDESFIGQYLSPKLMRDFRLFSIVDDEQESESSRSRPSTTRAATAMCARRSHQYDLGSREPNIQVWNVNLRGDRSLTPPHPAQDRPLHDTAQKCSSTWRGCGLRRAPRQRQQPRRDDQALGGAGAGEPRLTPAGLRAGRSSPG